MANITAQDNSLSFLTDTLGGFVGRAATKLDAFSSDLEGMIDTIFMAISYGYVDSVSSSRIVINTYYPTSAQMIINGSGMTGNSFSINRITYSEYDGFYIRMSGNVRGNVYGDVSGSVTSAVIGNLEQSIAYVGSISMTTGAARYSSLTYTLRDVSGVATTTVSYGGSFVEDDYGVIRGTVTSFSYGRDADGAGSGAAQTLMSMTGLSRYVEMDIDTGRPFGFLPADTATFFSDMLNGADSISGGTGNDTLYGYAGNDLINGGAGADVMDGGEGDDVYYVDNAGDVVVEAVDEGTDLVLASVSHTLDDNVENLTLIGTAIDGTGNQLSNTLTGNAQANVLTGLGGNDTLIGGGGLDTLIGGDGDDIYVIDRADEIVTELADEGNDTVRIGYASPGRAAITVTLHDNVENLEVLGAGLFNLVGNAEANALTGNGSANVIDGGAGADEMTGGLGNDTYVVDDADDVVVEALNAGTDTVRASLNYVLGANVENLELTGSAVSGTGNALGNVLTGNGLDNELYGLGGNDVLVGGEGADLLDGGEGIDSMSGGAGDDTYVVDNVRDVVSEGLNAGTDTVRSALSYALGANVENLVLTGTAHLNGTGNALANVITGNSGNNILDGGVGADTLVGGEGDDQYVVDNIGDTITEADGEGTDSVRFTLANASGVALDLDLGADYAFVENATLAGAGLINLSGSGADNVLTGNAQANVLRGLEGDDELNGGAGADTLIGGEGDDLYIVDQAGDVVTENPGEGTDAVRVIYGNAGRVAVTLSLQTTYANVENLEVLGAGLFNLVGNAEANALTGNGSANVIDGGAGADEMTGGLGNDTYVVDDADDVVVEALNAGTDTVRASLNYVLGANVENLELTGSAVSGTGNALGNVLTGNGLDNELYGLGGNDVLVGGEGADLLDGGEGIDSMSGGAGDDTYVVDNVRDVVSEGLNAGTDTVRSALSYALGANVENLVLTGTAHLNGTGNALANVITGNSGNNILDGGVGADTLVGGEGDDQYVVDNIGDTITEADGEGTDSVRFTLANASGVALDLDLGADYAFVENATLAGAGLINLSGSGADNVLTGNAQANVLRGLEGDDELNGGAGADTLIGGEGDDLYIVDQAGDVVTENPGEGTDTVRVLYGHKAKAAVTLSLQTTYANVENLEVLGAGLFNLVGNAEANALTGNGSANVIDGGAGADEMTGGLGNDTYVVDDAGDVVIETAVKGSGVDLVRASVDYTLTANVENLTLEGGALEGTGNALANVITGNSGNNVLSGGLGDDVLLGGAGNDALLGGAGNDWLSGGDGLNTLTGGTGEDVFYFDAAPVPGTLQTIADFSLIDDRIVFDATVFDALGAGFDDTPVALPSELLQVGSGSAAADADVRLIYDTAAGALYYDADGNGAGDAVQIAQFTGKPLLSADHFEVLAS